jgi:hypothetical protein
MQIVSPRMAAGVESGEGMRGLVIGKQFGERAHRVADSFIRAHSGIGFVARLVQAAHDTPSVNGKQLSHRAHPSGLLMPAFYRLSVR